MNTSPITLIKELSLKTGVPFPVLCQHYAMERFLYRLGLSKYAHSFYLKGGMLLLGLGLPTARPTLDIDLLGQISNSQDVICEAIHSVLQTKPVTQDGITFSKDLRLSEIAKDALYTGTRVQFYANIQGIRVPMQVDIGFGDILFPKPMALDFPSLLPNNPCAHIQCYSIESLVAEKWQAMVQLDRFNSRMKDFYDLSILLQTRTFDATTLKESITRTFDRRGTCLKHYINLTSDDYCKHQQPAWATFIRKMKGSIHHRKLKHPLPSSRFGDVMDSLLNWLTPIMEQDTPAIWKPKLGWIAKPPPSGSPTAKPSGQPT